VYNRRVTRSGLLIAALALLALPAAALADPGPGRVEVRNESGASVGAQLSGPDAVEAAVARVHAGALARGNDALPWTIVIGAGTYGDVAVDEPNLTLLPSAGAQVVVTGTGGGDDTGGECVDITRGAVTVQGLTCRTPKGRGFEVAPPAGDGGVTLRQIVVDDAAQDGVAVLSGSAFLLQDATITSAGRDGVLLERLTGQGPYRIQGGRITASGHDGVDLANDAQRVQVAGVEIDTSRDNGIESDDAGSSDLMVDGVTLSRNRGDGALLGGGGRRLALLDSTVTGSGEYGVALGRGSGFTVRGDSFDGTNRSGDLDFSADARTGGAYDGLRFLDTALGLPGEPSGVVLGALTAGGRASLSRLPDGLASLQRFVRVKDSSGSSRSAVTLRFGTSPSDLAAFRLSRLAVYEDDPAGNGRTWQAMSGTQVDPAGAVEVTLSDRVIASGSDSRFAVYGPLAPLNAAPVIAGVYPAPNGAVVGRRLLVAARVGDDDVLGTGSFALVIDGRRRGGVSYRDGAAIFRLRLPLGRHDARLLVVDASGLRSTRAWSFTVRNARPTIVRRGALPRPGGFALSHGGRVRVRIRLKDDEPVVPALVRLRVDGRPVARRVRHGLLTARVRVRPGRHRLIVRVADLDGRARTRGWSFRVVGRR
jgi:hypothetical protein